MAKDRSAGSYVRSLLRIVAGFTFSCHGLQKLLGMFGGRQAHFPHLLWFAAVLESAGGALILIGLFTSPAAFVLSGEMAVAYFMQHYPHGFYPIRNGGELAVLYCFIFLYVFAAGPGPISFDHLVRKRTD